MIVREAKYQGVRDFEARARTCFVVSFFLPFFTRREGGWHGGDVCRKTLVCVGLFDKS